MAPYKSLELKSGEFCKNGELDSQYNKPNTDAIMKKGKSWDRHMSRIDSLKQTFMVE